ncbi:MAG: flagellar protein FliL, partial [Acidobacteriota bacterium]|nr:flagellar protein FliL [Acidobacteriota bacterium]
NDQQTSLFKTEAAPEQNKKIKIEGDAAARQDGQGGQIGQKVRKEEITGANEDEANIKPGIILLDPFTVNLNDPFARRYAEVSVNLVIDEKKLVTQITNNELLIPRIRDEIFMVISSRSFADLKSTSGKVTLKEEIMIRVNEILKQEFKKEPVIQVLFTKFLIQ